jgi:hypothetical protein
VTVAGLTTTSASDIDILLVGPGGQAVLLLSDARGYTRIDGADITFADGGDEPDAAPAGTVTGAHAWAPVDYDRNCSGYADTDTFPNGPAEYTNAGSLAAAFVGLSGDDVNGTWTLHVADDCLYDAGAITGGWELAIVDDTEALVASAACGEHFEVTISSGSGPFAILVADGSRDHVVGDDLVHGTYQLASHALWVDVRVEEHGGDGELLSLGTYACNAADLRLETTVSPAGAVLPGTRVTFTITVTNEAIAGDATGIVVTGGLGDEWAHYSDDGDGAYDHLADTWTVRNLAPGDRATLNLVATLLAARGTVHPEVLAMNEVDLDSAPANCESAGFEDDCAEVSVATIPPQRVFFTTPTLLTDLALRVSGDALNRAGARDYIIEVSNVSGLIAFGIDDFVTVPEGARLDRSSMPEGCSFASGTGTLRCSLPVLEAGSSSTWQFKLHGMNRLPPTLPGEVKSATFVSDLSNNVT